MQSNLLSLLALASSTLALAVRETDAAYPAVVEIKKWSNGLPKELIPGSQAQAKTQVVKRDQYNAGVYLCNDAQFSGYCVHFVAPKGNCIDLGDDLNDQVSAVGPDEGYTCTFYSAFNCNDSEGHFSTPYPGIADLSTYDSGNWNDRTSSYRCA